MSDQPDDRSGPYNQALNGTVECIYAFAVILAKRGLITREELADELGRYVQQLKHSGKEIAATQEEFSARVGPAIALVQALRIPVAGGPIVIKGGKDPDSDPPAAD